MARVPKELRVAVKLKQGYDVFNAGEVCGFVPSVAAMLVKNGIAEVVLPEQIAAEKKAAEAAEEKRLAEESKVLFEQKRALEAEARAKAAEDAKTAEKAKADRAAKAQADKDRAAADAQKKADAAKRAAEGGEPVKSQDGPPKDKQIKSPPKQK